MSADLAVHLRARQPIPLAVDFRVSPDELLALVGPSGSGKTTVLRAIAGLQRPQNGEIRCGDDAWLQTAQRVSWPPQARRVGLVFQDYALFPHLTALDNLQIAISDRSAARRRERARELLARVRLAGLEGRYPAQLSGGQQQRVAVARALARDPRVLLLDEPFSAVDMMTRARLQRELALLREEIDIPIVLVTHDLQEAAAMADRICVLHNGSSLQTGPPAQVFAQPRSAHVARLLGLQNVFAGIIARHRSGARLRWGQRELEVARLPDWPDGTRVDWYIPDSDILLHRRGRPSRGERENPVHGVVEECVRFGAQSSIVMRCVDTGDRLRFEVATHAARRNGLEPGVDADVSLLARGIHVMPASK